MDAVLRNLVGADCYVFLHDVIVYSKSAKEQTVRLEHVLARFDAVNLRLHHGKCALAQFQVNYLGFVLSENGVSSSPKKVKAVRQYRNPKNVRDVRAFLGLASFYRQLMPKFAELAKPLSMLTRKDREFSWGPTQQQAFESLKNRLSTAPVLAYPNFE